MTTSWRKPARSLLEQLYRSPLGRIMSELAWTIGRFHHPFMIYGYYDRSIHRWHKFTRISSSTVFVHREGCSIGNHVWVGHFSILDGSEGLTIEEGCQLAGWNGIYTHSSQNSIRLLGEQYVHIPYNERPGYIRGAITIRSYTFLGAGVKVLPGVTIGKGCIIGAGSVVTKDIPDYSLAVGLPAQVVGSTVDIDLEYFRQHECSDLYYDPAILEVIKAKLTKIE